jgi:hypothetical protein
MVTPKNYKASKKDIKNMRHSTYNSLLKNSNILKRTVDTQQPTLITNLPSSKYIKKKTIKDCDGQFSVKPHSYSLL